MYHLINFTSDTMKDDLLNLQIEYLLASPAADLYPTAKDWKGKTPFQVSKLMHAAFQNEFSGVISPHIAWPFKLRENTWAALDELIKFTAGVMSNNDDMLAFWEKMRCIVKFLYPPHDNRIQHQRRNFVRKHPDTLLPVADIGMCELCWRAVPARHGESLHQLRCHLHKGKTNEARQRARLKRIGLDTGLFNGQFPLIFIPDTLRNIKYGALPTDYLQHCPNALEYLNQLQVDITLASEVLVALEKPPASHEEPPDMHAARLNFYDTTIFEFKRYVEHLFMAETWLALEKAHQHGGKRSGAGRKPGSRKRY